MKTRKPEHAEALSAVLQDVERLGWSIQQAFVPELRITREEAGEIIEALTALIVHLLAAREALPNANGNYPGPLKAQDRAAILASLDMTLMEVLEKRGQL